MFWSINQEKSNNNAYYIKVDLRAVAVYNPG
jgi:hypothetical protein